MRHLITLTVELEGPGGAPRQRMPGQLAATIKDLLGDEILVDVTHQDHVDVVAYVVGSVHHRPTGQP